MECGPYGKSEIYVFPGESFVIMLQHTCFSFVKTVCFSVTGTMLAVAANIDSAFL